MDETRALRACALVVPLELPATTWPLKEALFQPARRASLVARGVKRAAPAATTMCEQPTLTLLQKLSVECC